MTTRVAPNRPSCSGSTRRSCRKASAPPDGSSWSIICVGNPDGNKGACYFDSGGPAVSGTTGSFRLVGATHGATGKCGEKPTVYTDVTQYQSWIEQQTGGAGSVRR
jgi:secreted trypsin-like serine protease